MTRALLAAFFLSILCSSALAEKEVKFYKEFEPKSGKGRVVLVISGHTGPENYEYIAKDLAEKGYLAVLLDGNDFWVKDGMPLMTKAIERAQKSSFAKPGKVSVVGYSLGGAAGLSFAARMPNHVAAVVACFPMTNYIDDPTAFVSKIKVPVLILAGVRDTYKGCCVIEKARQLADAAKATAGQVSLELVEYPCAHGFVIKSLPTYSRASASDAFERTLKQFSTYMSD